MQMSCHKLAAVLLLALFSASSVSCDNTSTTTAATTATPTTTTTAAKQTTAVTPVTTTSPTKVDISGSALCKRCLCDFANYQLDCSKREIVDWFSDDEWNSLQNAANTFKTINLEHNNLTKIPQLRTYAVENLYLGFNQIDSIAIGAFANLTSLKKLDLSHNKITSKVLIPDVFRGTFSTSVYFPMEKLTELDLGYNELHNLDADLFEHLPNLEVLILCKNTFKVVDHLTEIAIAGLTSLRTLDMSYMEIEELPEYFLHGPRALETLILTGNLLNELPDNLELAVNLKALVLDENLIEAIAAEEIFPPMEKLEYLSISYMPELKRIAIGGLSNLQSLTTLGASNNPKLSFISKDAFSKPTSNPRFRDYPPLKRLYLHNNNLSRFDSELLFRWDKVEEIDLRFNPWACDETNDFLVTVLMPQIQKSKPIWVDGVACGSPPEMKSISVLDPKAIEAVKVKRSSLTGAILVMALVGVLVGVPIIIATVVLYRRGCFGVLYRRSAPAGAHYSRAGSAEDLHI